MVISIQKVTRVDHGPAERPRSENDSGIANIPFRSHVEQGREIPRRLPAAVDVRQRIERAHRAFLDRAIKKLYRATELVEALDTQSAPDRPALIGELVDIAHSLSGTAGSFGFSRLSKSAEALEDVLSSESPQLEIVSDLVLKMASELIEQTYNAQVQD